MEYVHVVGWFLKLNRRTTRYTFITNNNFFGEKLHTHTKREIRIVGNLFDLLLITIREPLWEKPQEPINVESHLSIQWLLFTI